MNQNEEFLDKDAEYSYSPVNRFEEMLTQNIEYFFDVSEFEQIIEHYFNEGKLKEAKKAVVFSIGQHPTAGK